MEYILYKYPIICVLLCLIAGILVHNSSSLIPFIGVVILLYKVLINKSIFFLYYLIFIFYYGYTSSFLISLNNERTVFWVKKNSKYSGFAQVVTLKNNNDYVNLRLMPANSNPILIKTKLLEPNSSTFTYGDLLYVRMNIDTFQSQRYDWIPDYRSAMFRKRIFGRGYLRNIDYVKFGKEYKTWGNIFTVLRMKGIEELTNRYVSKESVAISSALIFGVSSFIDKELRELYVNAGIAHTLAVSGFHIGLYCFILIALLKYISSRSLWHRVFKLLILILFLVFIVALTGGSPSSFRSAVMFGLYFGAQMVFPKHNSLQVIMFTAWIMLMLNSSLLFDLGFQLSFAAVIGINLFYQKTRMIYINKFPKNLIFIADAYTLAISAYISTLPLQIYYFHTTNLNFLIFAVPISLVISIIIMSNFLILFIEISKIEVYLTEFLEWFINSFHQILLFLNKNSWVIFENLYWNKEMVFVFYAFIIILIIPFKFISKKYLVLYGLAGLFLLNAIENHYQLNDKIAIIQTTKEQSLHVIKNGICKEIILQSKSNFQKNMLYDKYNVIQNNNIEEIYSSEKFIRYHDYFYVNNSYYFINQSTNKIENLDPK